MVVGRRLRSRAMEPSRVQARLYASRRGKSRHAEMDNQDIRQSSKSASIYFARRPSPTTRLPQPLGKAFRQREAKVWPLLLDFRERAPTIAGSSPRRTVSTSGSSGIASHAGLRGSSATASRLAAEKGYLPTIPTQFADEISPPHLGKSVSGGVANEYFRTGPGRFGRRLFRHVVKVNIM